ncbi:MAG: chain length-determining protein, partial [Gammaproteobacteria bacterium]|nr:chain length-determining protein [Gammaproteobacteria bacterium]
MKDTIDRARRQLREMWHRRWVGLLVAWVVGVAAVVVIYRIPVQYEASARVFVDTNTLLRPLLSGLAVQPNVDQQVDLMGRTLISRPNVEKVVRNVDLDLDVRTDRDRDALIDRVMKAIKIAGNVRDNIYVISYQDVQPEQARKVVQALLTIFVESSLGDKRQDSVSAVRFLDEQIKHYEGTLRASEDRLKEFRLRYLGIAEREGGGYFNRVAALTQQIQQAKLDLEAAVQTRDSYKRELSGEQPTFIPSPSQQPQQPSVVDAVPEFDVRLAQLHKELDELSRRYTDRHPDVVHTKRIIGELEQQRKAELAARTKAAPEAAKSESSLTRNPVFQQLRLSAAEAEAQVAAARAKLNGLESQQAQLKAQARMVPQIEAELAQLNRDYDVQKKTYESLLARRESATMGIGVQDSGGAQFRVIDPPRVSSQPATPNRLALIG